MGEAKRKLLKGTGIEIRVLEENNIDDFVLKCIEANKHATNIANTFIQEISRLDQTSYRAICDYISDPWYLNKHAQSLANKHLLAAIWKELPSEFGKQPSFEMWNCCFDAVNIQLNEKP